MNRATVLATLRERAPQLRQQFGLRRLAVFGSAARDELRADSDIDVLVDFADPPTMERFFSTQDALQALLGRPVDLITVAGLKPRARVHACRSNAISSMSRDWQLHLDDLIGAAEKIGRLVAGRDLARWQADEAAVDAVLFNLQVIGESLKRLPPERLAELPESHRRDPIRLRDLIAHRYFALDASVIHDAATRHVPDLLMHALQMRQRSAG